MLIWNLGAASTPVASYQGLGRGNSRAVETEHAPSLLSPGDTASPAAFAPDEVLVRFDPATPIYALEQCLKSANAIRERRIAELNVSQLKVPTGRTAEAIASLKACPGVLYAEPNDDVSAADTLPADPGWSNQYGLAAIHAPQGWDLSSGSSTVTIAIVDSGVDLTHVDLADKIVPGYDFVNNDSIPQDDYGHGTHVAGIAAAITDNNVGIAGVSWGARIMPVKVLNASGNGSFANVAAGIVWAADNGARVINLSLGGNTPSSTLQDAVNYAYARGVIIVAAAGNSAGNSAFYPASYPHVIAVAATDSSNHHASFSNSGPDIAVAAPGVSIYSTMIGNTYGYLSGTSMAAPFVAGLAAILRGLPGDNSPDQIAQRLETSALDLGTPGRDDYYGYGLIQMDAAIKSAFSLSINKSGNGGGTVTSVPAGIACGAACSAFFEDNASVTLTAVPSTGSTFTGWSDTSCSGTGDCTLTMQADESITASFTLEEYSLTVTSDQGTVARSPDQPTYHYGDLVHLTAMPAAGYSFENWSGDINSTANPVYVNIRGDTSVTANYAQDGYTLMVTSDHGAVARSPDQPTYHYGDVVHLTATAAAWFTFDHWSDDIAGISNPIDITIHDNTSVTANYIARFYLPLVIQ